MVVISNGVCYNNYTMDLERTLSLIENDFSEKFGLFAELLLNYNKSVNLTSICDEKGVLYKHFLDSAAGEFLFPQGASVAEIGSGGGFPSVPLKILREDLNFTLIESTGKKCAFLQQVVEKLGFHGVKIRNIRAEDGARDKNLREKFDVVCARAVAQLNTLCEYCLPYVKIGGLFVAYKGEAAEELGRAEHAVKVLGGEIERVIPYELPEECGKRSLICVRKIKSTPSCYPRGQGKERKQPL